MGFPRLNNDASPFGECCPVEVEPSTHRYLREIDCSLTVVGRPPLALNPGANQYTSPAYSAKKCFIVAAAAGNITTTVNKGRQSKPMSSLLLLDVYASMTASCH